MSTPNYPFLLNQDQSRRKFIYNFTKVAGVAALLASPVISHADNFFAAPVTLGEGMDMFISQVPGAPISNTVDTLKAGSRDIQVTGIVTTMFATIEVIRKTIA